MKEFFIASAPIGGIKDVTMATINAVESADYILAEYIPKISWFLEQWKIQNKPAILEYGQDNSKHGAIHEEILSLINGGKRVVYLPEAGSIGIEDPGFALAKFLEENGVALRILPGPSSVIASYIAGLPMTDSKNRGGFSFQPIIDLDESQMEPYIESYVGHPNALIFLVHDPEMHAALKLMEKHYGPDRKLTMCMNVSLMDQRLVRTTLGEIVKNFTPEEFHKMYTTIVIDGQM